jgi:hypothetical protein
MPVRIGAKAHSFWESAPKHTADEEESLFPRLRQIQDPEIENALASLDALEADHHKANTLHGEVDVLGTRCLYERCLPQRKQRSFGRPSTTWLRFTRNTFGSRTK